MPDENACRYAAQLDADIVDIMGRMFENIAQEALRGSTVASETSIDMITKARKAHSIVWSIMNDSMRGLAAINESLTFRVALSAAGVDDEPQEPSPR